MENSEKEKLENREEITNQPVEQDYEAHKENPGPSLEAVTEKDDSSVGDVMKWLIPVLILLMLIIYFFVFSKK